MGRFSGSIGSGSTLGGRARLVFCAMLAALIAISMSGCATIISGTRQKIDIKSEQGGANVEIYNIRDKKVFESKNLPETARLKRGAGYFKSSEYVVKMSKEGSDTLKTTIESNVNLIPYLGNIYTGGIIGMVIVDPASGAMWRLDADILEADFDKGVINKYPRTDLWSTVRYSLPMGNMPNWVAIGLEYGNIWGNNVFCGIGIDGGFGQKKFTRTTIDSWTGEVIYAGRGVNEEILLGGGFSLGGVYDLPVEGLKLAYGGAAGYWWVSWVDGNNNEIESRNFLAPFVKLRWKFLELSYRGLIGTWDKEGESYCVYGECFDSGDSGFGWNNHQISIGVYFEGNKRWKPKDKR